MDNLLALLPSIDAGTGLVQVVIDTPRGSRNKYKYDQKLGCFRLSRILPAGHAFPFDFGSIPRTRAEDGDALDVLVLGEEPSFAGCLIRARLLGVLVARQKSGRRLIRNDRLIGLPETPVNKPAIRDLKQLDPELLRQIELFFVAYNRAQGREFEPLRREGATRARRLLEAAMSAFGQEAGS